MKFSFPRNNIFRGSVVHLRPSSSIGDPKACVVEFGDGNVVHGSFRSESPTSLILTVPAYRTAKDTAVDQKRWRLKVAQRTSEWVVADLIPIYGSAPPQKTTGI